jgi:hypothetical protein
MNLKEYIVGAIETESRISAVTVDVIQLKHILSSVIAAGNLLDVIKKDTFYGLPQDAAKLEARELRLEDNSLILRRAATAAAAKNKATDVQTLLKLDPRVVHAIIGLATESVELLEALYTAIDTGEPIDGINILEELGDLNWYHAIAVDALNGDWEQIQYANLAKLAKRNKGKKFDAAATINRDVVAERTLLEQHLAAPTLLGPTDC